MTTLQTENDSSKNPKKLSSDKRRFNKQDLGQFLKEHNIKTKPTDINICTRADTVYRYYDDTDTLSIYFAKASSGVVSYCKEANKYILVSYDHDDKIVSVEIFGASKLLRCHLFDTQATLDNKPPLSLYPICHGDRNELEVFLTSEALSTTFQKTGEKDFEVGVDDRNKIAVLLFHNVSSRIAKTLPEEEREKLAEKAKLRSLEIAKWTHLLDY